MSTYDSLTEIFGTEIKSIICNLPNGQLDKLEEIRLRAGSPLAVNKSGGSLFLKQGMVTALTKNVDEAFIVRPKDLMEALTLISGYSLYAFEEEIRNGFISVKGGHRVGLCGKAVVENNEIKTIKSISSLNIRICREIKGSADSVMRYIVKNGAVKHTIIVSPPGKGKTTLLRDIIRQLSSGITHLGFKGADIGVVDERSEIAGMFMGVPQNDIGPRTDVLDCCPKAKGMHMLLRSMSPSVVAVDEIGRRDDVNAIEEILNAGIKLICTVHGDGIDDIKKKPYLKDLIEKRLFETVIVLSGKGTAGEIENIYDETL